MKFIKPNLVYRPGLSIGQDHGFADKLGLSFIEFGEDVARSRFGAWHDVARIGCGKAGVAYESVYLVADARQRGVDGTPPRNLSSPFPLRQRLSGRSWRTMRSAGGR
jgi:hypothetical protein